MGRGSFLRSEWDIRNKCHRVDCWLLHGRNRVNNTLHIDIDRKFLENFIYRIDSIQWESNLNFNHRSTCSNLLPMPHLSVHIGECDWFPNGMGYCKYFRQSDELAQSLLCVCYVDVYIQVGISLAIAHTHSVQILHDVRLPLWIFHSLIVFGYGKQKERNNVVICNNICMSY